MRLLTMLQLQSNEVSGTPSSKPALDGQPATSLKIRTFFNQMTDPVREYDNIRHHFIPDTCQWIFATDEWRLHTAPTKDGDPPGILVLSGPSGTGKSHLAVSAYDHLVKSADNTICVARFYFRAQRSEDFRSFSTVEGEDMQLQSSGRHLSGPLPSGQWA